MMADWSQLGDFEVTTPVADLLQDISDKGIPTSADEVRHTFFVLAPIPCRCCPVASFLLPLHSW